MAPNEDESSAIYKQVSKKFAGISNDQRQLVKNLCTSGQEHLFEHWAGMSPTIRKQLAEQLMNLDREYQDGGLVGYISNAKKLLESSKNGVNPLEGWTPSIPEGQAFELGSKEFTATEKIGLKEVGTVGFVLVAGGLGERLGYGNIKVGLPTELTTGTCYLQHYIDNILAIQRKYSPEGVKLPLCIMTSNDTSEKTRKLLLNNNCFGMDKRQITIVEQGIGVPALIDNDARIAMDPKNFRISTKPHGHGDIHSLLYSEKVIEKWQESGINWVVFLQDTNGLAFHTLPLMLGVSKKLSLIMNSLAVPRKAKQAIGGIAKLTNKETKEEKTINVEYNQLDPLLRASGFEDGDVNDKETGFSPYPGNINQILFEVTGYKEALDKTKGLMPEFVNPKYADEKKEKFKKPTRLECMMQDFPTVLEGADAKRVGFTSVSADMCFSPVKNATADGVKLQEEGTHPAVAATGEADQYAAQRKIMRSIGCQIDDAEEEEYLGIKVSPGPQIVLKPSFVRFPIEYSTVFPTPEFVRISPTSTLVVRGSGVIIESLKLDGCLIIDVDEGETLRIKGEVIKNEGWLKVRVNDEKDEVIKMRGYKLVRKDAKWIEKRSTPGPCCVM